MVSRLEHLRYIPSRSADFRCSTDRHPCYAEVPPSFLVWRPMLTGGNRAVPGELHVAPGSSLWGRTTGRSLEAYNAYR